MREVEEFLEKNRSVFYSGTYSCEGITDLQSLRVIYPLLLVYKCDFFFLLGLAVLGHYCIADLSVLCFKNLTV